jgi:FkbM family methyltransferase
MNALKEKLRALFPSLYARIRRQRLLKAAAAPVGFYSQFGEDQVIDRFWHLADPSRDIFVDVGAWHPIRLSNTFRLYKKGMRGIIVEPSDEFVDDYALVRPEDLLLTSCAGESFDLLTFTFFESGLLNTLNPEAAEAYIAQGNKVRKRKLMPVIPLEFVLEKRDFDRIFLLDIDAEGFDFEVLKGCGEFIDRVMVLTIETDIHPKSLSSIEAHLQAHGFVFVERKEVTSIWVNSRFVPTENVTPSAGQTGAVVGA